MNRLINIKLDKKKSVYYIIILALIIYIVFIDSASFLRRYQTRRKLETVMADVQALKKENDRLRRENESLENDKKIWEEKARELGMQKKGDEVFIFKDENDK